MIDTVHCTLGCTRPLPGLRDGELPCFFMKEAVLCWQRRKDLSEPEWQDNGERTASIRTASSFAKLTPPSSIQNHAFISPSRTSNMNVGLKHLVLSLVTMAIFVVIPSRTVSVKRSCGPVCSKDKSSFSDPCDNEPARDCLRCHIELGVPYCQYTACNCRDFILPSHSH